MGKRFWLVFGFGMHIGIDLGMNVGTFANVMMAVYLAWLSGDEIDAFWRALASRPLKAGEGDRCETTGNLLQRLAAIDTPTKLLGFVVLRGNRFRHANPAA